jgi:hypothetical protein
MPVSSTRAGMRNYVPRRPGTTLDDVITPEIRAKRKKMLEEVQDDKDREKTDAAPTTKTEMGQKLAKGGSVSSRADGIAQRGKTRGKMC